MTKLIAALQNGGGGTGVSAGYTSTEVVTDIKSQATDWFTIQNAGNFIKNIVQVALVLGAIATLIWLLWGGIEYIMSGANQERMKTAKDKIIQAIIGMAILAAAWAIWRLAAFFLGITSSAGGGFSLPIPAP